MLTRSMNSGFKAQHDLQWPEGAPDPDQLASAPTIQRPGRFYPVGSEEFPYWNKREINPRLKAQYDPQWPQGAPDPYQLAFAPTIWRPGGFYTMGGDGFPDWDTQKMKARLQELARERVFLLERLAECDSQVEAGQLDALHKDAIAEYQKHQDRMDTHLSREKPSLWSYIRTERELAKRNRPNS